MKTTIAIDHETHLWETGNIAPKIVCTSLAMREPCTSPNMLNELQTDLLAFDEGTREFLAGTYADDEIEVVGHHFHFDLACEIGSWPYLLPLVFKKLENGFVHDTEIREKLLNLATHGQLRNWDGGEDLAEGEDTPKVLLEYNLAALSAKYLGKDRKDEKESEDAWRKNFKLLDGLPAAQYPPEAAKYARDDAEDTLLIYEAQEILRHSLQLERGFDVFATEGFQTAVAFALQLMSCWGWKIDRGAKREIEEMLARELDPAKHQPLYDAGILIPAKPPRPYKRGSKNEDGTVRMTPPEKEKAKRKPLLDLIERVCAAHDLELKRNDATEAAKLKLGDDCDGSIKATSDVLEELAPFDPLLEIYRNRQKVQKLLTTELPRMESPIDVVHSVFEVLVSTGRTSCHESSDYASANLQNVDPRARKCYVPRAGHVLLSVDYQQLEFCSMAQKCFKLFGYSVVRDKINAGVDLHAFLGAQCAYRLDENFRGACDEEGVQDREAVFEVFKTCEKHEAEAVRAIYSKFRKMAKPAGFGFPGGLGAKKFVTFARANPYNVVVTIDQAKELKEIWLETYPEFQDYVKWISNSCADPWNGKDAYTYTSPLGMVRSGATYCAACNGAMLQTPAAEGAKMAVFEVQRACYDSSMQSCLYGCRSLTFNHDEIILEVPDDDYLHERALEVGRLMTEAMQVIMPDVRIRAMAAAMRRWNKDAKPQYNAKGRLEIWTDPQLTPPVAALVGVA